MINSRSTHIDNCTCYPGYIGLGTTFAKCAILAPPGSSTSIIGNMIEVFANLTWLQSGDGFDASEFERIFAEYLMCNASQVRRMQS